MRADHRRPARSRGTFVCLVVALFASGCGSDAKKTCPEGEARDDAGDCVCAPGFVTTLVDELEICAPCEVGTHCAGGDAPAVTCADGTWDHDADPGTPCAARSDCEPGTYVISEGDATHDRSCVRCADGTYTDTPNALECTPWVGCPPGTETIIPGTVRGGPACIRGWVRQGPSAPQPTEARGVAFDSSGRVIVAGTVFNVVAPFVLEGDPAYWIFTPSGDPYDDFDVVAPGEDRIYAVAVDEADKIYIAGSTHSTLEPPFEADEDSHSILFKRPSPGNWGRIFGWNFDGGPDGARALALAPGGLVHVAGFTSGEWSSSSPNEGETDAYVYTFDATGTPASLPFLIGSSKADTALGVAAGAANEVVVVGQVGGTIAGTASLGGKDAFIRRYSSTWTVEWTQVFGTAGDDDARAVLIDWNARILVAGTLDGGARSYVKKLEPDGDEIWSYEDERLEVTAIAIDPEGNVVVTGNVREEVLFGGISSAGGQDVFLLRLAWEDGAVLSLERFGTNADDYAASVAVDSSGHVAIAGWTYGDFGGLAPREASDAFVIYVEAP